MLIPRITAGDIASCFNESMLENPDGVRHKKRGRERYNMEYRGLDSIRHRSTVGDTE